MERKSEKLGSIFVEGEENFLFSEGSRQVLEISQSAMNWIPGTISPSVKETGRKPDHRHSCNVG